MPLGSHPQAYILGVHGIDLMHATVPVPYFSLINIDSKRLCRYLKLSCRLQRGVYIDLIAFKTMAGRLATTS